MGESTDLPLLKVCTACKQAKPLASFSKGNDQFGKTYACKQCNAERLRVWRATDHGNLVYRRANRRATLRRFYGLAIEDYERMFAEQNGLCAICQKSPLKKKLNVDHNHATGRIRSLLCGPCNRGLGQFMESPDLLRKAAAYLNAHAGAVDDSLRDRPL